jgi:hypothetical protein
MGLCYEHITLIHQHIKIQSTSYEDIILENLKSIIIHNCKNQNSQL